MCSSCLAADISAAAEPRKGSAAPKKRYSIRVREYGSGREIELCQVDSNPEKIAEAAGRKLLRISSLGRQHRIKRYDTIRIIDNGEASIVPQTPAEQRPDNAALDFFAAERPRS